MLTCELEQILHILVYKILTDIYLVLHYGFFLIKQIGIFTKWEKFWQVGWFSMKLFWVKSIMSWPIRDQGGIVTQKSNKILQVGCQVFFLLRQRSGKRTITLPKVRIQKNNLLVLGCRVGNKCFVKMFVNEWNVIKLSNCLICKPIYLQIRNELDFLGIQFTAFGMHHKRISLQHTLTSCGSLITATLLRGSFFCWRIFGVSLNGNIFCSSLGMVNCVICLTFLSTGYIKIK